MQIFLHLGTNVGDKKANLQLAKTLIAAQCGPIIKVSRLYQTEAWGLKDQDDFINQALEIQTDLSPQELITKVKQIEKEAGRKQAIKWGPRLLDIDIIFYAQQIIEEADLIIPHPHIAERNFVLIPLMEIANEFVHPVLKENIEEIYLKSEDLLEVIQLED